MTCSFDGKLLATPVCDFAVEARFAGSKADVRVVVSVNCICDRYFTSPRVVSEGLHLQLSKSLMKFLNAVNDNDQGPLTLEPNPLAVFEDLRHEAFSSDEVCAAVCCFVAIVGPVGAYCLLEACC